MNVALVAAGLAVVARLLACALIQSERVVVRTRVTSCPEIIFFSSLRIRALRLQRAVGGGHDHRFTLPYLPNPRQGLFAPQVFAIISLFVLLRRIDRRPGSEHQAQISG